ncbi:MAG: hypothetical protein K2R98_05240 [Gemmataceae bacterium]|nr:hypothetical protein [Gemmataceae bacterium]
MNKHELAEQLRECHRQHGAAPTHFIDLMPDDLIIEAYITCNRCQERMVDDEVLAACIAQAQDFRTFFQLIDRNARHSQ